MSGPRWRVSVANSVRCAVRAWFHQPAVVGNVGEPSGFVALGRCGYRRNALILGIVLCVAWAILSWSRACVAPGFVGSWGFEYFGTSLPSCDLTLTHQHCKISRWETHTGPFSEPFLSGFRPHTFRVFTRYSEIFILCRLRGAAAARGWRGTAAVVPVPCPPPCTHRTTSTVQSTVLRTLRRYSFLRHAHGAHARRRCTRTWGPTPAYTVQTASHNDANQPTAASVTREPPKGIIRICDQDPPTRQ